MNEHLLLGRLNEVLPRFTHRPNVIGPISVLVTTLVVLPTAKFDFDGTRALLTASQWEAVTKAAFLLSLIWLAIASVRWYRRKTLTSQEVLDYLMQGSTDP